LSAHSATALDEETGVDDNHPKGGRV